MARRETARPMVDDLCNQEMQPVQPGRDGKKAPPLPAVRVVRSVELLQGRNELLIIHGNTTYRLVRTRNDKLMLQR